MKFCRIDLSKTNYTTDTIDWQIIAPPHDYIDDLNLIYTKYCTYKRFSSVMPIFNSQYTDPWSDVIGYYHSDQLVAFSLIKRYDLENAECLQFAWDYEQPELKIGIESLKVECAIYKAQGFKYLYLGQAAEYKSKIDGYQELGPI